MSDRCRDYHEMTLMLLLVVTVEVTDGVTSALAVLALVLLLVTVVRRDVNRWRARRKVDA